MAGLGVLEVSDATFEQEVLKSEQPVLVDFWAVWCGPCRAIAPIVDGVAQTYAGKLKVVIRVLFRRDGSVAAPPELVAGTPSALGPAMAESAKRAILSCQPFTMLNPEHYDQWKDMEINFDPTEMLGG